MRLHVCRSLPFEAEHIQAQFLFGHRGRVRENAGDLPFVHDDDAIRQTHHFGQISRARERLILAVTLLIALPSILLARQQSQVWRDTQSLFANVLRHFPTSHVALNNIGFLHLQKNDLPSAEAYFQRALAEKPQYPDAEVNLGVVYAKQGKLDEAEALFRQALRQEPTNAQATFNLAGIAFTKGNYPEAIRLYEETLRLRPGYRPAERQLEEAGERLAESE